MADRRDGHSRRGGDRSYDNRDRRRDRDGHRDRDDYSKRHNGPRDHGRDRDRDRDRDSRRYRSRSRDRGDRRRSRSPGRERGYDRRDADRDRGHRRRDEGRGTPQREGGDRSVRGDRERSERDKHIRDGHTTPESPGHSASPRRAFDRDADEQQQLPTRSKPSSVTPTAPAAPVSFKVKSHSRDGSHGPEAHHPSTATREDSEDGPRHPEDGGDRQQQPSRGRFDAEPMDEDEDEDLEVEDDGLDDMAAMMGFGGFGTTKGKKVLGNNVGGARKEKKTEYRQYMNRVGGFNRPLSPSR